MPDGAIKATERQFLTLLQAAAAEDVNVSLSLYALPDIPRSASGKQHLSHSHSSLEDLWSSRLDGLIITGAEPTAPKLTDEPYWNSLRRVLDWAEDNTQSTIFSCLAAHAAVQHFDGIARRPLKAKRFGLFESVKVADHPLTESVPPAFAVPHSRWNDLPEEQLAGCGYQVLRRSSGGGVDLFVKRRKSLLVFFQGHPEYEANTLLLEFRRDLGRYLKGERPTYPGVPEDYFGRESEEILTKLEERAAQDRHPRVLESFPASAMETSLKNGWRLPAARIYANWLQYLVQARNQSPAQMLDSTLALP